MQLPVGLMSDQEKDHPESTIEIAPNQYELLSTTMGTGCCSKPAGHKCCGKHQHGKTSDKPL